MSMRSFPAVLALVLLSAAAGAEEPEKSEKAGGPVVPLKVQVVFARYQGEKKVSSMPYTLYVNAGDRATVMRMGISVPLMVRIDAANPATIMFKDVGTNLDCSAEALADGRFKLNFSLEQASIFSVNGDRKAAGGTIADAAISSTPVLRNFRSVSNLVLRDGQTGQYLAATDPVGGDLLKIDVTLAVVK